ncbi:MAG: thiolase family protein [Caldilineae bacterium]|nr:MAG: thiolase family protein [Caldilineae bacterium]
MTSLKGSIAIVGIGEVPTGRYPDRSAIFCALEAARQAIADAGLHKDDIDTVIPTAALYDSKFNTDLVTGRIVEELGLRVRNNLQLFAGGATSAIMLKVAAGLITAGVSEAILFVHADKLGSGVSGQAGIDLFSTAGISKEWEVPFGMHYSAVAGLITQRYMFETGTTPEQLASVCVSNRKWAELNPHAMFRKPLTIEQVLASKLLSTPLHAYESNMLADGGAAFVVTSAARARELVERPVYLLGEGSRVTHFALSQEPDMARFGYAAAARDAFDMAGLSPADMDLAELYDSYPVFQLIALEELGLCERGTAGAFVMAGHTWPGGKLPMTTNGGMLSQGHTGAGGGIAILVEAARQLMGKAGARQVPNARFAVETATGGTYVDAHVTILGNQIP